MNPADNKYQKLINSGYILSAFLSCFPNILPGIYLLMAVFLTDFFFRGNKPEFNLGTNRLPLLFLCVFVCFMLLSLFYSTNMTYGMSQFGKLIPFLIVILGATFFRSKTLMSFERLVSAYSMGVIFLLILTVFHLSYEYVFGQLQGRLVIGGFGNVDVLGFLMHRTYVGVIILLALPHWIMLVRTKKDFWIKAAYTIIIIYAHFIIILSGGRGVLLSTPILLIYMLFWGLNLKLLLRTKLMILTLFLGLVFFAMLNLPRFHAIPTNLSVSSLNEEVGEMRLRTWSCSVDLIKSKWLLGYGIGDAKQELLNQYEKKGYMTAVARELNAHNQYLEVWLGGGVIPLFGLICFLISLCFLKGSKRLYGTSFAIIIGVNMLFESFWLRNMGVWISAFWLFCLLMPNNDDVEENSNAISLNTCWFMLAALLMLVAMGLLLSASRIAFNAVKPRTYMTVPFGEVIEDEWKTDVVNVKLTDIEFKPTSHSKMALIPLYKGNKGDEKVLVNVKVKLSENVQLKAFRLYLSGELGEIVISEDYDLDSLGTWQCLRIEAKQLPSPYALGVRLDAPKEVDIYEGYLEFKELTVKVGIE